MAGWLLPLAALFMGAGTGASFLGDRQAQRAREDALAAERIREQGYRREIADINEDQRERYDDLQPQMQQRQMALAEMFAPTPARPTDALPQADSNITVQSDAKAGAEASAYSGQQGDARARLRGFGDTLGDILRQQGRDSGQIGMVQGLRRGSQAVLPLELDAAAQKGGGLRLLGGVLSGVGQLGMTAGLANPASLPTWLGGGGGLPGTFPGGAAPRAFPPAPGGLY